MHLILKANSTYQDWINGLVMDACMPFVRWEEKQEVKRGLSYYDEVLFSDLVEDHLADVMLVERGRQWNFCPLIISTHQQVGFIWRKGKVETD